MWYMAVVMHVCDDNKRLEIPSDCPAYLAELLTLCWLKNYEKRPDIDEVIENLGKLISSHCMLAILNNFFGLTKS